MSEAQAESRWAVASRTAAAILGGYGITALATVTLSRVLVHLGVAKSEAIVGPTLASFAIFAAIAMAAFHARSPARAWAGMTVAAAVLLPLYLLLRDAG
jgi:hypothetical protein